MPEARVNGIRLYYEEHGQGVPILCIHGGGSTALMWADAFDELARLGRVIAYDRRGCTRSERPEPYRTSVREQADDAAALLELLDAPPAVVIGRSYGGAVAIDLALGYPESVRALALLEGDALGLAPSAREWTARLRDRLQAVAADDGIDAVYEALIEEVLGEGEWEEFPAEAREILAANGPALLAEMEYVDEDMPGADAFASVDCPVLLVSATESQVAQREMNDAMAQALPDARTALVAGGHLVNPAAREVLAFVEEVVATGYA